MAADRKPYHKSCVKCFSCRISLNPGTLNEHEEKLYCNLCYTKIFNPGEFTCDNYGGIVTPEDIERYFLKYLHSAILSVSIMLYQNTTSQLFSVYNYCNYFMPIKNCNFKVYIILYIQAKGKRKTVSIFEKNTYYGFEWLHYFRLLSTT